MSIITIDQDKAEKLQKQKRLDQLLEFLKETDYVALADYDKDKPDLIIQRKQWREEVREIEALLNIGSTH